MKRDPGLAGQERTEGKREAKSRGPPTCLSPVPGARPGGGGVRRKPRTRRPEAPPAGAEPEDRGLRAAGLERLWPSRFRLERACPGARVTHARGFASRCPCDGVGRVHRGGGGGGRAGPGNGGALQAGAGAMAPVLNLNNEVSQPPPPPLGWRSEQAGGGGWGGLGRGGPGGGSGRWRRPGHREGSGRAGRRRVTLRAGRFGPDPSQGRRGCLERWGRPRSGPGRGCRHAAWDGYRPATPGPGNAAHRCGSQPKGCVMKVTMCPAKINCLYWGATQLSACVFRFNVLSLSVIWSSYHVMSYCVFALNFYRWPTKVSAACLLDRKDMMLPYCLGGGGAENEKLMG